jgi:nitric oxide synthase oxygenase domain/subunit
MECEITRDLLEPNRMDKMEAIARAIGVDSADEDDFWRERVSLETNKGKAPTFSLLSSAACFANAFTLQLLYTVLDGMEIQLSTM